MLATLIATVVTTSALRCGDRCGHAWAMPTAERRAALDALANQPPTEDGEQLRALWRQLVDAFDGTPPAEVFHTLELLDLDAVVDLEAERQWWADRTGGELREPTGGPVR